MSTEEVRRPEDGELVGFVAHGPDGWQALTVFHGVLGHAPDRAGAAAIVAERGMSSLAERWHYRPSDAEPWQTVVPVEARPGEVRLALGYYSMPGVPTVLVTSADLAAGMRLTLDAPPAPRLLGVVEEAVHEHDVRCDVLECDPELADTAAFCAHYGFGLDQAANTILVASRKVEPPRYAVCVVLGTTRLDVNRKVSELLGVKRLSFADAQTTVDLTGMQIGGVTAFGITGLPIYIDSAVLAQEAVVMGGGNRSSKLLVAPAEVLKLPNARVIEGLAVAR